MSILSCPTCAVEFTSGRSGAKYCSRPCKDKGKPSAQGLTCCICSQPMTKGRTSKPQGEAAHNKCRTESGDVRTHGCGGYRRGCRCEICRDAVRRSMRAYSERVRIRDGVSPTQKARPKKASGQFCTVCGGELKRVALSESPTHKECRRRRTPGLLHKRFQAKIDKAARGTRSNRVFVAGGCSWCGTYFVGAGAAASYCSDKCKTQATFRKRSSGKTFKISPKKRLEVYDRDGWTCQLCKNAVNPNEHYLSDFAPSLDHIIPQSLQLVPDHSPGNLRLVHRWCNSSRGDGSNMSDAEFQRRVQLKFSEVGLAA